MRSNPIQKILVYVLSAALILTLGMRFQSSNNHVATAIPAVSSVPSASIPLNEQHILPISTPSPLIAMNTSVTKSTPNEDGSKLVPKNQNEVHIAVTPIATTYEVTAYFLNGSNSLTVHWRLIYPKERQS